MLLNWYNYSITGIWNWTAKVFERCFHAIIKLGWLPDAFYIILIVFLLGLWMVMMNNYYGHHRDKGLID